MKASIKNYFKPTPENVIKWLLAWKGVVLAIGGATLLTGNPTIAFFVLLSGAIADELAKMFKDEDTDK